jgi:hypothetical protein
VQLLVVFATCFVIFAWSGVATAQYYSAIKKYEPKIWQKIGAPNLFTIRATFYGLEKTQLFQEIQNKKVLKLARVSMLSRKIATASFFVFIANIAWDMLNAS